MLVDVLIHTDEIHPFIKSPDFKEIFKCFKQEDSALHINPTKSATVRTIFLDINTITFFIKYILYHYTDVYIIYLYII